MSEIADRYRRLAAAFIATVAAVPPDRWSAPTPCEDWDARAVVGHVADSQGIFLRYAGRELGDDRPSVADDPVAAWVHARDLMQAVLDDPELAGQEFDGFFGRTRVDAGVDRFLCMDLVVHRWDLARATGLDETMSDDELEQLREGIAALGDTIHSPGVCGPAVEVSADADEQAKVLAELGRRA